MITYQTEGVDMPAIKKRETSAWIKAVAETYGKKVGEIAYIFCSDEKILEVNRQYLQHDYTRISLRSTIVKAIGFPVIFSSVSTPYAPMLNNSVPLTKQSCTG